MHRRRRSNKEAAVLIDTTLREGEQAFGNYFSEQTRQRLAEGLFALGLDELECGCVGREGLNGFLAWARGRAGRTALSVWCPCRTRDVEAAAGLGADRVNLGLPASEAHREKRLGLTRAGLFLRLKAVLARARDLGVPYVSVGLEDVSRADPDFALDLAHAAQELGAARIRLADSVGVLCPRDMERLLTPFLRHLRVPLAVHCHNDFGMATANAVTALSCGALFADVSLLGLGERAGIAALEEVAAWLVFRRDCASYDLSGLRGLCGLAAQAANQPLARDKAVIGADAFAAESGLHVHALAKDPALFEPFDPARVGGERKIAVGAKSGRAAVAGALGLAPQAAEELVRLVRAKARELGRPLTESEVRQMRAAG
jgi:homocitrate synthase NifV